MLVQAGEAGEVMSKTQSAIPTLPTTNSSGVDDLDKRHFMQNKGCCKEFACCN